MAIKLGQIIVELQARTDAFTKGLSDAKNYTFTSVDGIVASLGKIGDAFAKLKFDNASQINRSLTIMGGVAAGAAVAAAAALGEMTKKGIETAAKFELLSQSTGVSTETLSALGFAAKQNGVELDSLATAMERFSRTALTAAQGGMRGQTAFRQLGISVTDAQGRMKPTNELMLEVADRFSKMQDGALKTGLAMQLFGRAGAQMIPMLNQGREGLAALENQAKTLGIVIDSDTAAAAHRFEQDINLLKAAGEGFALQITKEMLPALDFLAGKLKETFASGGAQNLAHDMGVAAKGAIAVADTFLHAFDQIGIALESLGRLVLGVFETIGGALFGLAEAAVLASRASFRASIFDFAGAKEDLDRGFSALKSQTQHGLGEISGAFTDFWNNSKKTWADNAAFITGIMDGKNAPSKEARKPGTAPGVVSTQVDVLGQTVAKLKEQAQAELALAQAQLIGEQSARATLAASAAEKLAMEAAIKLAGQEKISLAAAQAQVEAKIGADIRAFTALNEDAKVSAAFNKSLSDGVRDNAIAADAQDRLAQATLKGGAAVRQATIANQLDAMVRKAGIQLTDQQRQKLEELAAALRKVQAEELTARFATQTVTMQHAIEATRALTMAHMSDNETQIQAQARIEALNFAYQNNIDINDRRIKQLQEAYANQLRANQVQQTANELINNYDPAKKYQQSLDQINQAIKAKIGLEEDDVRVQAALNVALGQYIQANAKLAADAEMGPWAGIRTQLALLTMQYASVTQAFQNATQSALTGIGNSFRTAFTSILMGTKSIGQGFAEMGRSMVESVVQALAQIVEQWIMTHVILAALNKIFGTDLGQGFDASAQTAANAGLATSDAFLAAANALATVPFPANIAASAEVLALGLGYAAGASASGAIASGSAMGSGISGAIPSGAGGFDVPFDTLMQVHAQEVVLPARLSRGFKDIINSFSMPKSVQSGGGPALHFYDNSSFSSINAEGMADVLNTHRRALASTIQGLIDGRHLKLNPA